MPHAEVGGRGRTLDGANRWPADEPALRKTVEQYMSKVERIAFALTGAFAAGLGMEEHALQHLFQPHHSAFLRLNYYPPRSAREGPLAAQRREQAPADEPELGIHPHKDAGFLTVILQVGPMGVGGRCGIWERGHSDDRDSPTWRGGGGRGALLFTTPRISVVAGAICIGSMKDTWFFLATVWNWGFFFIFLQNCLMTSF
jgi:hypothetical protein